MRISLEPIWRRQISLALRLRQNSAMPILSKGPSFQIDSLTPKAAIPSIVKEISKTITSIGKGSFSPLLSPPLKAFVSLANQRNVAVSRYSRSRGEIEVAAIDVEMGVG